MLDMILDYYEDANDRVDEFLTAHPTVKSTWRMALIVTLAGVAQHFGVYDLLSDVVNATGAPGGQ